MDRKDKKNFLYLYLFYNYKNGLEVTGYSVAVLKSSDYDKLDDLDGKTMGYLKMDEEKSKFLAILKSKISCEVIFYDDIYSLYENLLDKKIDSIIIDEAYLDTF